MLISEDQPGQMLHLARVGTNIDSEASLESSYEYAGRVLVQLRMSSLRLHLREDVLEGGCTSKD